MAKKPLPELTDLQIRILTVLWERGSASATDVHEALAPSTGLSRKTIGTLLFRLEQQAIVGHVSSGREYLYVARVTREQVRKETVKNVAGQLFSGELPAMVSYALESGEMNPGDIRRIRALLDGLED